MCATNGKEWRHGGLKAIANPRWGPSLGGLPSETCIHTQRCVLISLQAHIYGRYCKYLTTGTTMVPYRDMVVVGMSATDNRARQVSLCWLDTYSDHVHVHDHPHTDVHPPTFSDICWSSPVNWQAALTIHATSPGAWDHRSREYCLTLEGPMR